MQTERNQKNKRGRPLKHTSGELILLVEQYFKECEEKKEMPNKAGLCVLLKISKETYNIYKKKKAFVDSIKDFESKTENIWVQRLGGTTPTGAIFYLKNAFDYRDKQEIEQSGKIDIKINYGQKVK